MERQALLKVMGALKAGRVLSQENEDALKRAEELIHAASSGNDRTQLAEAETLLEQVLSQVDPSYADVEKSGAIEVKSFPLAELKALPDEAPGSFEAVVAVFGNVDSVGDRMEKGAFKRTLSERGLPPVVWSHQWETPPIGTVDRAEETDEGLLIKGRLFVGAEDDHPVARQVYTAMKAKDGNGQSPLREFSFGYATRDSAEETKDGQDIRVLKDVDLFEVGPTLVGANPETRLVSVKALAAELQRAVGPQQGTDDNTRSTPKGQESASRIGWMALARPYHNDKQEG